MGGGSRIPFFIQFFWPGTFFIQLVFFIVYTIQCIFIYTSKGAARRGRSAKGSRNETKACYGRRFGKKKEVWVSPALIEVDFLERQ